ncbi:hypothetical protein [Ideonella sp. YS5]|uniref:hypothetical protein n=1 Tax=Ideonella sp. YS5 TaxID=3453714 RepID=UPI003EE8BEE9
MPSPLVDLDELILECRDPRAKTCLAEAVNSYRAGALRASIVATWIAVCFDLIDKLRELALAGDKTAEKHIEELDKTRQTNDFLRALKFERELLDLARDQFELISHLEHVDLARLRDDRNRCAHPSLISDEQAYIPSAELVRTHIHAAVSHLLRHPPVQGKFALERLCMEVGSDYFPTDVKAACIVLGSGPLKKPRASLTRNFVVLMLKHLLCEGPVGKAARRYAAALQAVGVLHHAQYDSVMREKLTAIFRGVDHSRLARCARFLQLVGDCWQYLERDQHLRLIAYVEHLPDEDLKSVGSLLDCPPLRDAATARIADTSWANIMEAVTSAVELPAPLADRAIALLRGAESFADANGIAGELVAHATTFSLEQINVLVENAANNKNVRECDQLSSLLDACRKNVRLPAGHLDSLLSTHKLASCAEDDPGEL